MKTALGRTRTGSFPAWACYLIAVAVPLALVVSWHSINTVYPNDDCANYYETAQDIYFKFKSGGLGSGLLSAYYDRGWRPILFPVLAVPFMAIAGGDVIASVALTLISLYLVFLTYAYLISREFLPPGRALLCTVFAGTIPWVMVFTYYFMSEMALMAASMAALYHLKKSGLFTSRLHSPLSGLAVGLGLAIRPVEFFLAFGALAVILVTLSRRKGAVLARDLAATVPFAAITGLLFIAAAFNYMENRETLLKWGAVSILLSATPLLLLRRHRLNIPFISAFFVCNSLVVLWWLPFFRDLLAWVRETTGIVGELYHDRGKMGFFKAAASFFTDLGGWPLLITSALFVVSMLLLKDRKKNPAAQGFFAYNLAAVSMIIPPVFMLSLTTDIAYRRAFAGFSALLLVNAIFAVHHAIGFRRTRLTIVFCLAFFQVLTASLYAFDLYPALRGRLSPFYMQGPPLRGGDPSERFFGRLKGLGLEGHKDIAVLSLSQTQYQERPFDTSALNLVAKKNGSVLRFSYPAVFMDLDEGYRLLRRNWRYAIVDVSTGNPANDPYSRLTADIMERWKRGGLEKVKLRRLASIQTPPALAAALPPPDKTILLLEVIKDRARERPPEGVKITASSCMFLLDSGRGAELLMNEGGTIWHAKSPPEYPEWVLMEYEKPKKAVRLSVRSQEDSLNGDEHTRGPRDFVLQGSADKKAWKSLIEVEGNSFTSGGQWKDWEFRNDRAYRFYRLYIKSGNNPDMLTIKQIRLSREDGTAAAGGRCG